MSSDHVERDPFTVLKLSKNASNREIKKQFHKLAKELHPDTGSQPNEAALKEASKAHETLINPAKRRAYDLKRALGRANAEARKRAEQVRTAREQHERATAEAKVTDIRQQTGRTQAPPTQPSNPEPASARASTAPGPAPRASTPNSTATFDAETYADAWPPSSPSTDISSMVIPGIVGLFVWCVAVYLVVSLLFAMAGSSPEKSTGGEVLLVGLFAAPIVLTITLLPQRR
jgi:hypothetical protein